MPHHHYAQHSRVRRERVNRRRWLSRLHRRRTCRPFGGAGMTLSTGLGVISVIASVIACVIAIRSDHIVKSMANLEYDEKLGVMAHHRDAVKTDKSLGEIELIKHDFRAVSNLQKYASKMKREELIENHIIPILEEIL